MYNVNFFLSHTVGMLTMGGGVVLFNSARITWGRWGSGCRPYEGGGVPILPEDLGQMELFHNQVALGGGDSLCSVVETLHQVPLHMGGVG